MRTSALVVVSVGILLVLLPLTLGKPGLPMQLEGDEATQYMAAMSLAHDGDLRCDEVDRQRLFDEFVFGADSLRLFSSDDGQRFAAPIAYVAVAAGAARALGSNAILSLQLLLLFGIIGLGAKRLSDANEPAIAALFATGFVLLSPLFVYAFWLQSEVFHAFLAAVALYFGLRDSDGAVTREGEPPTPGAGRRSVISGLALGIAAHGAPVVGALALPLLWRRFRRGDRAGVGIWAASAVVAFALIVAASTALIGHAFAYSPGSDELALYQPYDQPEPLATETATYDGAYPGLAHFGQSSLYFLIGRHTGIAPYMPFAVIAFLLFVLTRERNPSGLALALALAAAATALLLLLPFDWAGGTSFIGNRAFLPIYPAFLFLVRGIRPRWMIAVGFAGAGFLIGPLLFTPLGATGPTLGMHSHARHNGLSLFPLEKTLFDRISGLREFDYGEVKIHVREELVLAYEHSIWLQGGIDVELWLESEQPIVDAVFEVRNIAPDNVVSLSLGDSNERLAFGAVGPEGETRRVTLVPAAVKAVAGIAGPRYLYELHVATTTGEEPLWRTDEKIGFFIGADLLYLGDSSSSGGDDPE